MPKSMPNLNAAFIRSKMTIIRGISIHQKGKPKQIFHRVSTGSMGIQTQLRNQKKITRYLRLITTPISILRIVW
jgi:hypothetical protein